MRFFHPVLVLSIVLILAGCGTPSNGPAHFDQAGSGSTASLTQAEAAWKHNPENIGASLSYARALSQAGRYNRAAIILAPLAEGAGAKNAILRTQLSEIRSNLNAYDEAEDEARAAIALAPDSARAHAALGTALDGLNKYPEAEIEYRKALKLGDSNDTQILNSLGLNLASQGFIGDAMDTLKRASEISPGDRDIERNIRIVTALAAQPKPFGWKNIPPPQKKPESIAKSGGKLDDAAKAPVKDEVAADAKPEDMSQDHKEKTATADNVKKTGAVGPAPIPVHNN